MAEEIALVHLVWAPLGPQMLDGFLEALQAHPGGAEHTLAVILNGFGGRETFTLDEARARLAGRQPELIVPARALSDLAAYRLAAERLDAPRLCFLNSYSRPLCDGWLARLDEALSGRIGLVGASGSFESALSAAPFWLRPLRLRRFGAFPNPHVRSNAFMLERELMLSLDWDAGRSKASAWALESGRRSITNQVLRRGLGAAVVGRDGVVYPSERWRQSATFRSGSQRNLLVADNRTEQYEAAEPAFKRTLERMAWGSPES